VIALRIPIVGDIVRALLPRYDDTRTLTPAERLAAWELRLGANRAERRIREARVAAKLDRRAAARLPAPRRAWNYGPVPRHRSLVVIDP
jgi:hypothetical protein